MSEGIQSYPESMLRSLTKINANRQVYSDQISALFPSHTIIYAFAFKGPSHVQNFYSERSL